MRIARAIASGITLAVLTVGVPVALVTFGRLPGWDDLADLPGEMLTDTTALALLTALAWVTWALFTAVVAVELAGVLAGARRWRLPAATPFQASARRLVEAEPLKEPSSKWGRKFADTRSVQMPDALCDLVAVLGLAYLGPYDEGIDDPVQLIELANQLAGAGAPALLAELKSPDLRLTGLEKALGFAGLVLDEP